MREIDIIIDGRRADTFQNTAITLNFNSSILGDITSIKCNGSQTITLPRTANNDRIFDLATVPSYDSSARGVYMPCVMRVDDITIFDDGFCHLLNTSGDEYEIAITWGVMQNLGEWVNSKKKLRDLRQYAEDSVAWNSTSLGKRGGVTRIEDSPNKVPFSMAFYGYNCGVTDKNKINVHPSVSLLEIWERIRRENGLDFNLDGVFRDNMEKHAVVLKNNNTSLQTITKLLQISSAPSTISGPRISNVKELYFDLGDETLFDPSISSFVQVGYGKADVYIGRIYLSLIDDQTGKGAENFAKERYELRILGDSYHFFYSETTDIANTIVFEVNQTIKTNYTEGLDGISILGMSVKLHKWEDLPDDVWKYPNDKKWGDYSLCESLRFTMGGQDNASLNDPITYTYQNNSNDYPLAEFTLVPNLPDMTQIDFVKFICHYYGLFPVKDGSAVDFVRLDVLRDNIDNGEIIDWSNKHVTDHADAPQTIEFALDGYAQRNVVTYKDDKNDPVNLSASVNVEDKTLDTDRDMIVFPFAATRGDSIPQYYINDNGELEKNNCEYRLMQIDWATVSLSFAETMTPQQIVNRYYNTFQEIVRRPIVIEDDFLLDELDLQKIDYSRPVYLSKYGRYFAIVSIQWQSDQQTCKVKLLRIK